MKAKIFLSSIVTIALCLSLIVGSTFALFSKTETVNIAVTAGKLDVSAYIPDTIVKKLSYGDATYKPDTNELVITTMVPGDEVSFEIEITDKSSIQFNYEITATSAGEDGVDLLDALDYKVVLGEGWECTMKKDSNGVNRYSTGIIAPDDGKPLPSKIKVTLIFPATGDHNAYQGAKTNITFTVVATQADNATANP